MKKTKGPGYRMLQLVFICYLLLLVRLIIFKYPLDQIRSIINGWSKAVVWEGMHTANFTLFKTIKMYIQYADRLNSFENLVGNIAAFIPFGFLFPFVLRRGSNLVVLLVHVFLFVLGIEVFQLFSAFGAFDVDDLLLNCFGAIIGWLLYITISSGKAGRSSRTH